MEKIEITVPGSKSYTHRLMIGSALSDGICTIENALDSEDTCLTINALKKLGILISKTRGKTVVCGNRGVFKEFPEPIRLGNSGTSMRFLTALLGLGQGKYTLTGTKQMCMRPVEDLLDGLRQIRVKARSVNGDGSPPVEITGRKIQGGRVSIAGNKSSQFISAILMIGPLTQNKIEIIAKDEPVSKPYIDMTLNIMKMFGIQTKREGYKKFVVPGNQTYMHGSYIAEPDCSNAGYFWAAAALTRSYVKVKGISPYTRQGDVGFVNILKTMGCNTFYHTDGIAVSGGPLSGISVDMADMPDIVPTLAVVAAFAKGATVIKNIMHIKAKESDRVAAVIKELSKMNIQAFHTKSDLIIKGGTPQPAEIDTYNDHRIAMSFAIAGLVTPGMVIRDKKCVAKSFPNFWDVFEKLKTETRKIKKR